MARSKSDHQTGRLLRNASGQDQLFEKSYEEELEGQAGRPVDCLGLTFEDDDARRAHFLAKLKEGLEELHGKLGGVPFRSVDDTVARLRAIDVWPIGNEPVLRILAERMRHAESSKDLLQRWKDELGFPYGEIEDILNLSDPPYYTACPNPFTQEFVAQFGRPYDPNTDAYSREPFAADVTEGKNDPIYNAHTYHTKVPHRAIMRYILHYTEPGDLVLDGFCGTGMTGVAAQACATPPPSFKGQIEGEWAATGQTVSWGGRRSILCDLSPAATLIAGNYNLPFDVQLFEREANRVITETEAVLQWMWETLHSDGKTKGIVKNTVWSDIFLCPQCTDELVFFDAAVNQEDGSVSSTFSCPHCSAELTKRGLSRATEMHFDNWLSKPIRRPRRVPVVIKYQIGNRSFEKPPDENDLKMLLQVEDKISDHFVPTPPLMFRENTWGDLQRGYHEGITHAHHFYFPRTLWALSELAFRCEGSESSNLLRLLFTSQLINISKMNRYRPRVSFPYNPMSGTLYVGSQICESNPFIAYRNKIRKIVSAKEQTLVRGSVAVTTETASRLHDHLPPNSIDYIFVDPPFGDNLPYSELSFLWESWLRVFTNTKEEAIISRIQHKGLSQYTSLMCECFVAMYSCLKPGRWVTVEFHNSKNSVWSSIQESLGLAGFVIADVRVLDKGARTKKQITGANAVKQDLVISAYKPNGGLDERFKLEAGLEDGVWDFVRSHLRQLPVFCIERWASRGSRRAPELPTL